MNKWGKFLEKTVVLRPWENITGSKVLTTELKT